MPRKTTAIVSTAGIIIATIITIHINPAAARYPPTACGAIISHINCMTTPSPAIECMACSEATRNHQAIADVAASAARLRRFCSR